MKISYVILATFLWFLVGGYVSIPELQKDFYNNSHMFSDFSLAFGFVYKYLLPIFAPLIFMLWATVVAIVPN